MINTLIVFLQKIQTWNIKGALATVYLLVVGGLTILLLWSLSDHISFDTLTVTERSILGVCYVLLILILIALVISRKKKDQIVHYCYSIFLPLLLIIEVCIYIGFGSRSLLIDGSVIHGATSSFLLGFNGERVPRLALILTSIYPLIRLFSLLRRSYSISYGRFENIFRSYNVAYYFIFALYTLLQVFRNIYMKERSYDFLPFYPGIFVLLVYIVIFTFPFVSFRKYYKDVNFRFNSLVFGVIAVVTVLFFTTSASSLLKGYFDTLREKAASSLFQGGINYESFTKAHRLGLETAYLRYFKHYGYIYDLNFNKLFDSTPEEYFADKLNIDSDGSSRLGTNATQVNKNAQVVLKLVEINTFIDSGDISKTIYSFHLQNTTDINQESIIYFQAPSAYSVVSDLKLGLNGEMQGVVASRGAARKVYEDAIKIFVNKDPALIEKIGSHTYSLRIFPIPSKLHELSHGQQLVQVTILTPLDKNLTLTRLPKFSFLNLRTIDQSSLIYKSYIRGVLTESTVYKDEGLKTILTIGDGKEGIGQSGGESPFCISKNTLSLLSEYINSNPPSRGGSSYEGSTVFTIKDIYNAQSGHIDDKVALFFDNSLSAKRNNTKAIYHTIYNTIKQSGSLLRDIDLYSYNFTVEKLASLDDLKYRGYSDSIGVMDFIEKNNIQNQHIIIVTDDDSFTLSTHEDTTRDLGKIGTNRIHVIAIGQGIKRYKPDFMNIITLNAGGVYSLNTLREVGSIVHTIFSSSFSGFGICSNNEEIYNNSEHEKISAGVLGSWLLKMVHNKNDWGRVALLQNKLASHYNIVNQFNSLIAMEDQQQKEDLRRYEGEYDRFTSSLDLAGTNQGVSRSEPSLPPESLDMGKDDSMDLAEEPMFDDSTTNSNTTASPSDGVSPFKMTDSDNRGFTPPSDESNAFMKTNTTSYTSYLYHSKINTGFWGIISIGLVYIIMFYQIMSTILLLRNSLRKESENSSISEEK